MSAGSVLILDKPSGPTSREAVSMVKSAVGARKAGHAGTLDPLATGVLVVCLDRATLLTGYLGSGDKVYDVAAILGVETDTYDVQGKVTGGGLRGEIRRENVRQALQSMVGTVEQFPPPFSAVKVDGQPMHRYARRGVAVSPRARKVEVRGIELLDLARNSEVARARLTVYCGPGTYIRVIVHEMGRMLGCGACVERLRRTVSGSFSVPEAVSMDEVLEGGREMVSSRGLTMEEATGEMNTVIVNGEGEKAARLGRPLEFQMLKEEGFSLEGEARVLGTRGDLLAIYGPPRALDGPSVAARAVRVIRTPEGLAE